DRSRSLQRFRSAAARYNLQTHGRTVMDEEEPSSRPPFDWDEPATLIDRKALDHLFSVTYEELRRLASSVRRDDMHASLSPTALLHASIRGRRRWSRAAISAVSTWRKRRRCSPCPRPRSCGTGGQRKPGSPRRSRETRGNRHHGAPWIAHVGRRFSPCSTKP